MPQTSPASLRARLNQKEDQALQLFRQMIQKVFEIWELSGNLEDLLQMNWQLPMDAMEAIVSGLSTAQDLEYIHPESLKEIILKAVLTEYAE